MRRLVSSVGFVDSASSYSRGCCHRHSLLSVVSVLSARPREDEGGDISPSSDQSDRNASIVVLSQQKSSGSARLRRSWKPLSSIQTSIRTAPPRLPPPRSQPRTLPRPRQLRPPANTAQMRLPSPTIRPLPALMPRTMTPPPLGLKAT